MRFVFIHYWFFVAITVYCRSEFLSHLLVYLSDDLKVNKVNFIIDSPGNLSTKAVGFVQSLIGSLPTIIVSGQLLKLAQQSQDRQCNRTREVLMKKSEHSTLKILIIDVRDNTNIEKVLMDYMNLFAHYPPNYKRSKCLIIIFNQAGSFDMAGFFRHSWSLHFLYVTLINVNDTIEVNNAIPIRTQIKSSDVTVHQYNPFRNHTCTLSYSEGHKLFMNKLKNLHGYPLNIAFYESIPLIMLKRNHPTNQFLTDDLYGVDVIISRTLAEVMNFSLFVKMNTSGIPPDILYQHLRNNTVDFVVNVMVVAGARNSNENSTNIFSIFLQPFGQKLILKQEGYYEFHYFWYLLVAVALSVITATFSILLCLLPFNSEYWNTYNIVLLLLGTTPAVKLQKSSERVLYLSFAFISMTISVELLNNLMSNMLRERKFRHYETLSDVVEANMVIGISKYIAKFFTMTPTMEKFFNISKDLSNFEGASDCISSLLSSGSHSVNGCSVNPAMADLVTSSYSDPNSEWTIGTLTGPDPYGLGMTWMAMGFSVSSVYVDECNLILRRLVEAGFITYWRNKDHARRYLKESRSNHFKNESFKFNTADQMGVVLEYKKVELNVQMIGILILGWGISCLSFVFEMIWRAFKKSRYKIRKQSLE